MMEAALSWEASLPRHFVSDDEEGEIPLKSHLHLSIPNHSSKSHCLKY